MDADRFDRLTLSLAATASRRGMLRSATAGLVGLGGLGLGSDAEVEANRKKKGKKKKKKGCRKDAQCKNPNNPCKKGVCKNRKCRKETLPNGESCGDELVCFDGACGVGCDPSGAPCSDDETCCGDDCVDTSTDFANCGGCGDACSLALANACVAGECVCGGEVCTGGEVCVGGECGT